MKNEVINDDKTDVTKLKLAGGIEGTNHNLGNICIKYDEDLDVYIVCSKKFESIDDIDDTSEFLVVRKFEYMILN